VRGETQEKTKVKAKAKVKGKERGKMKAREPTKNDFWEAREFPREESNTPSLLSIEFDLRQLPPLPRL
jgi:hypothetical protein